jgi:dihydroflavonol-4-reductase
MLAAVTGASGHIGANLVRALLARGNRVRVLVRNDARALRGLPVQAVHGDARDPVAVGTLLDGADTAFHLAGLVSLDPRDAPELESHNIEGPRAVAEACLVRGVRLVHVSSVHALLTHDGPVDETRPLAEDHPFAYDRSKARGEREVLLRCARGLHAVIVNPTAVVGPFDFKPSPTGWMLIQLARGRLPLLVGAGFDWVDVRDVAEGCMAAAEKGRSGERYLLTGTRASLTELARLASDVTGARRPIGAVPIPLARLGLPFGALVARITGRPARFTHEALEALVNHRDVRRDKAERELGYRPRPLAATLADSYAWLKETGSL